MDYSNASSLWTHMSDMGLPARVPCIVALGKYLCRVFDIQQDSSRSRHFIHESYTAMDVLPWHNSNGSCSLDPAPPSISWDDRMMSTSDPSSGSTEENPDKKVHVRGQHHSLQFWATELVATSSIEVSEFRH